MVGYVSLLFLVLFFVICKSIGGIDFYDLGFVGLDCVFRLDFDGIVLILFGILMFFE